MNLGQLRTSVKENLGILANDGFFTDTMLNGFINKALRKIDSEHEWPWNQVTDTLATVNNQEYVSLPAGWTKTIALTINENDSLEAVSLASLRSLGTSGIGMPTQFAIQSDKIYIRPVPNDVFSFTHDYMVTEPTLTADGNTPRLPEQYHDAIVDLACFYGALKAKEMGMADRFQDAYTHWISIMRKDVRRMTSAPSIYVRPGSWL